MLSAKRPPSYKGHELICLKAINLLALSSFRSNVVLFFSLSKMLSFNWTSRIVRIAFRTSSSSLKTCSAVIGKWGLGCIKFFPDRDMQEITVRWQGLWAYQKKIRTPTHMCATHVTRLRRFIQQIRRYSLYREIFQSKVSGTPYCKVIKIFMCVAPQIFLQVLLWDTLYLKH